ncbi:MAG: hypothetical protein LBV37_02815, partial [Mycoplasmataceae bacterium]|nr:hypothetical protein [Mycoplasmataceae bacterium]
MNKIHLNRNLACLALSGTTIPLAGFTSQLVNHTLEQVCETMPSWMGTNTTTNVKALSNNNAYLTQRTVADGNDINVDIDEDYIKTFSINFGLKRLYFSNDMNKIGADRVITTIKQNDINGDTFNSGTCEGDWNFDLKERLQDWTLPFRDHMYVDVKDRTKGNWQVGPLKLYYENAVIWKKNESYKSINVPIVFGTQTDRSYTYSNGSQLLFNTGINRDFTNGLSSDIRGLPYVYMKETQKIYVGYNYVNRYMWSIFPTGNDQYENVSIANTNGEDIKAGSFDLSNIIEISDVSYNNATATLRLNRDLFNVGSLNEEQERLTLAAITAKYQETEYIKVMKEWIAAHVIDLSNFDYAHSLYVKYKSSSFPSWQTYASLYLPKDAPAKNYVAATKFGYKSTD